MWHLPAAGYLCRNKETEMCPESLVDYKMKHIRNIYMCVNGYRTFEFVGPFRACLYVVLAAAATVTVEVKATHTFCWARQATLLHL